MKQSAPSDRRAVGENHSSKSHFLPFSPIGSSSIYYSLGAVRGSWPCSIFLRTFVEHFMVVEEPADRGQVGLYSQCDKTLHTVKQFLLLRWGGGGGGQTSVADPACETGRQEE